MSKNSYNLPLDDLTNLDRTLGKVDPNIPTKLRPEPFTEVKEAEIEREEGAGGISYNLFLNSMVPRDKRTEDVPIEQRVYVYASEWVHGGMNWRFSISHGVANTEYERKWHAKYREEYSREDLEKVKRLFEILQNTYERVDEREKRNEKIRLLTEQEAKEAEEKRNRSPRGRLRRLKRRINIHLG